MNSKNGQINKITNCPRTIVFRDAVVEHVVDKFIDRSNLGYAKYGRTLDAERRGKHKDLLGYLNDIQEELMDAILYIQAAREEMKDQLDYQSNKRFDNFSQEGYDDSSRTCTNCSCGYED
jgi:hypothetical protein